ncbi:MAG: DNA alkylation repair protein [Gemmatimonadaceae bacterium]
MAEPLKNQFGAPVVRRLGEEIASVYREFDRKAFEREALAGFEAMELLDRGRHLGRVLAAHLPAEFPKAVDVLLATLPEHKAPAGGMSSFFYLPHMEFVRQFGVAHFEASMRALHAFTQVFTGEFALRPFLEQHEARTLKQLHAWTRDPSEHVRRLVSEGTRARLPWAPRLRSFEKDPTPVIALLEKLKDDPELYVRRSVANNLNDIGKDHPKRLIALAAAWMKDASAEREWIVRHALRSSVKQGDTAALKVLGFGRKSALKVVEHSITPAKPTMGGKVAITATLENPTKRPQQVVVDLVVHFVKAKGGTSAKVFKFSNVSLRGGERITLRKTVSLANLTTRRHYPGAHRVELQLNGAVQSLGKFTLLPRA